MDWTHNLKLFEESIMAKQQGIQQTMNFEGKAVDGLTMGDAKIVRDFLKKSMLIHAIKHVRSVTIMSLVESKELCEKIRDDMGWNGKFGEECKFSNS
jgi:ribosomal protein L7/L12